MPGVFSQTEDGLGLRTNIGMRGANPYRTTKINVTVDGILQGPAVYSNSSMYFYPDAGDAEGIEVLKGATAIGNGPRTTSGAINYISRSVPTEGTKGHFNQTAGDEGYLRNHVYYGQAMGNLSFVAESHKTAYDGHKEIDAGAGNDTNSGFRKNSDLFKISICSKHPISVSGCSAWFKPVKLSCCRVKHIMPMCPFDLERLKLEPTRCFVLIQLIFHVGI